MARKPPSWLVGLWRSSEAELGDALEEYAGGASLLWFIRQTIASFQRPIHSHVERRPIMISNVWRDLRYAMRGLRHNPGFSCAAILAIALGVGINTGIFSVLNGFLLREIDVPAAGELRSIHRILEGIPDRGVHGSATMVSTEEYRLFRDQAKTLSGLMAYAPFMEVTLDGERLQRINGDLVTCGYFRTLELQPALGSLFTEVNCSDEIESPVVVLSYDLWRNSFGADTAIVGRSVVLNRQSFRVVGVAPEGFRGIEFRPALYFAPITAQQLLRADATYREDPRMSWLQLVGRRRRGASDSAVRAELSVIEAQLDRRQAGRRSTILLGRATAFSMPRERGRILTVAGIVMAAFALVLLVACANVAKVMFPIYYSSPYGGRSRSLARSAASARS